jgi:hypothetical protein
MAGLIRIHKPQLWLFLAGVILLLLAAKQMPGFITAGPPLPLDNRPALLFFNSEEGCECVLDFYVLADTVVDGWPAAPGRTFPFTAFSSRSGRIYSGATRSLARRSSSCLMAAATSSGGTAASPATRRSSSWKPVVRRYRHWR